MIVANFSWMVTITLNMGLSHSMDQDLADLTGGVPLLAVSI